MFVPVECYAHGERGRRTYRAVPMDRLVGPNTGLLEALFRDRDCSRPLDVGDIVLIPDVGRFVCLPTGWALVPPGWVPPLAPDGAPLDPADWPLGDTPIVHPDDTLDEPTFLPRSKRKQRSKGPPPPRKPDGPLTDASQRLREGRPAPSGRDADPQEPSG